MEAFEKLLQGKKTYLSAIAVVVYVIGGKLGYWPVDEEIAAALVAVGIASLRAGVKNVEKISKP